MTVADVERMIYQYQESDSISVRDSLLADFLTAFNRLPEDEKEELRHSIQVVAFERLAKASQVIAQLKSLRRQLGLDQPSSPQGMKGAGAPRAKEQEDQREENGTQLRGA